MNKFIRLFFLVFLLPGFACATVVPAKPAGTVQYGVSGAYFSSPAEACAYLVCSGTPGPVPSGYPAPDIGCYMGPSPPCSASSAGKFARVIYPYCPDTSTPGTLNSDGITATCPSSSTAQAVCPSNSKLNSDGKTCTCNTGYFDNGGTCTQSSCKAGRVSDRDFVAGTETGAAASDWTYVDSGEFNTAQCQDGCKVKVYSGTHVTACWSVAPFVKGHPVYCSYTAQQTGDSCSNSNVYSPQEGVASSTRGTPSDGSSNQPCAAGQQSYEVNGVQKCYTLSGNSAVPVPSPNDIATKTTTNTCAAQSDGSTLCVTQVCNDATGKCSSTATNYPAGSQTPSNLPSKTVEPLNPVGGTSSGSGSGTGSGTNFPSDYARMGEASSAADKVNAKLDDIYTKWTTTTDAPGDSAFSPDESQSKDFGTSFQSLTNWQMPSHQSQCPTPSFTLWGRAYSITSHCDLVTNNFGALSVVMQAVWSVLALFLVFKA